jgi:hypothetical protein
MSLSPKRGKRTKRSTKTNRETPHQSTLSSAALTKDSNLKNSTTEKNQSSIRAPILQTQTELSEDANRPCTEPSTAEEIPERIIKILRKLRIGSRRVKGWLWLLLTSLFLLWKVLQQIENILRYIKQLW